MRSTIPLATIAELYSQGLTLKQTAQHIGRSHNAVWLRLRSAGIPTRNQVGRVR